MASGSSSSPFFGLRDGDAQKQQYGQHQQAAAAIPSSSTAPPPKKRRNQPGTPNPDAEVIALSPKSLLATNRFICEVCNKGFQREQNLQLHRRGHNLPWKLRQKSTKEPRRRVYLCPEPTCVHHDPSRALGDLTGIKKHFSRKHGEKKWKCDKCSKRYAVQSDWKAHSKTCGTREYRCDCGTLFSRRDSFITHRAFCDALAQEGGGGGSSSRLLHSPLPSLGSHLYSNANPINLPLPMPSPLHDQTHHLGSSSAITTHFNQLLSAPSPFLLHDLQPKPFHGFVPPPTTSPTDIFNLSYFSGGGSSNTTGQHPEMLLPEHAAMFHASASAPQMSATELLEKAAQIGATANRNGLRGAFDDGNGDAQLQDLMNSLVSEQQSGFGGYGGNLGGGLEGLTRDFLGVGGAVQLGPVGREMKIPGSRGTFGGLEGENYLDRLT